MKKLLIIGSMLLAVDLQASSDVIVSSDDHVYLSEVQASSRHKFNTWGGSAPTLANDVYATEHSNALLNSECSSFDLIRILPRGGSVILEDEAPRLHAMVARHAKKLGIENPLIMLYNSKNKSNATAASMALSTNGHVGVLLIYEDVLSYLTDKEFEGIICRNLAYIKNENTLVNEFRFDAIRFLLGLCSFLAPIPLIQRAGEGPPSDSFMIAMISIWVGAFTLSEAGALLFFTKMLRRQEKIADIGGAYNKEQARNLANAMRKFQEKHDINDKAWDTTIELIKSSSGITDRQRSNLLSRAKISKFLGDNQVIRFLKKLYAPHPEIADRIEYLIEHEKTLTQQTVLKYNK